ncbi:MAG: hypothetical protein ACJA2K_000524 [Thalassolituus sp.]|jgi:hypothetical protein
MRVHFQHSQYSKKRPDTKIQYRAFFFKLVEMAGLITTLRASVVPPLLSRKLD